MTGDVDIYGAAALMRRSGSWMQRHWRKLVETDGFPPPFVGAERHARPWWRAAAIEAWKDGRRFADPAPTETRRPAPANDPVAPHSPGRRVSALVAAAGGGQ